VRAYAVICTGERHGQAMDAGASHGESNAKEPVENDSELDDEDDEDDEDDASDKQKSFFLQRNEKQACNVVEKCTAYQSLQLEHHI
jgi:hypothetical protein